MAEKIRDKIARVLREQILDGTYPPGSQLPYITELMTEHNAARETVRTALSELSNAGLITTMRGYGTFVRDTASVALAYHPERAAQLWSQQTNEAATADKLVHTEWQKAGVDVGHRLDVDPDTSVLCRVRHQHRGRQAVQVHELWLTEDLVEQIKNVGAHLDDVQNPPANDLYSLFREAGISPTEVTENVLTRMPDPDDTEALKLPPGVPVLMTYRVTRDTKGRALEASTFTAAGDRMSLSYTVPLS